jgi:hypothetical protein
VVIHLLCMFGSQLTVLPVDLLLELACQFTYSPQYLLNFARVNRCMWQLLVSDVAIVSSTVGFSRHEAICDEMTANWLWRQVYQRRFLARSAIESWPSECRWLMMQFQLLLQTTKIDMNAMQDSTHKHVYPVWYQLCRQRSQAADVWRKSCDDDLLTRLRHSSVSAWQDWGLPLKHAELLAFDRYIAREGTFSCMHNANHHHANKRRDTAKAGVDLTELMHHRIITGYRALLFSKSRLFIIETFCKQLDFENVSDLNSTVSFQSSLDACKRLHRQVTIWPSVTLRVLPHSLIVVPPNTDHHCWLSGMDDDYVVVVIQQNINQQASFSQLTQTRVIAWCVQTGQLLLYHYLPGAVIDLQLRAGLLLIQNDWTVKDRYMLWNLHLIRANIFSTVHQHTRSPRQNDDLLIIYDKAPHYRTVRFSHLHPLSSDQRSIILENGYALDRYSYPEYALFEHWCTHNQYHWRMVFPGTDQSPAWVLTECSTQAPLPEFSIYNSSCVDIDRVVLNGFCQNEEQSSLFLYSISEQKFLWRHSYRGLSLSRDGDGMDGHTIQSPLISPYLTPLSSSFQVDSHTMRPYHDEEMDEEEVDDPDLDDCLFLPDQDMFVVCSTTLISGYVLGAGTLKYRLTVPYSESRQPRRLIDSLCFIEVTTDVSRFVNNATQRGMQTWSFPSVSALPSYVLPTNPSLPVRTSTKDCHTQLYAILLDAQAGTLYQIKLPGNCAKLKGYHVGFDFIVLQHDDISLCESVYSTFTSTHR